MSDLTIQLLGGVSHGRIITVPDTTEKISVPVMRVKCEHSPDGAGVETVTVTYRQGENTRLGAWVADQDFDFLGWWCQVCIMNAEVTLRESQVKALRADIVRVRELHKPWKYESAELSDICSHCHDEPYPCPTIKALDSEQS